MTGRPDPEPLAAVLRCRHWIFDLDGTLTHPVHDFDAIRRELGVPGGRPILEHLDTLPEPVATPLRHRLDAIEAAACARATARPGAARLLAGLRARGCRIGIVSRNSLGSVCRTLEVAGLADLVEPGDLLGRDEAAPKPSPDGLRRLLAAWDAPPADAVMVGDFLFDLQAGRAAGVRTVYLDWDGSGRWHGEADLTLGSLDTLLPG